MDYGLRGRVAVVTGASRSNGIGAATSRALAAAGVNVFISYYRPYDRVLGSGGEEREAAELLDELSAFGGHSGALELDLGDPDAPRHLFDSVVAALGPVDILINNAAYDVLSDIYSITPEQLDAHYAVNVRGTALLCHEFAIRHTGRPGGRIISLTSGQGLHPMPDNLPYALTKGAVEVLTTSLSAQLAAKGITVNAVDPGPTDTGWMSADQFAAVRARAPFGRVATPEDAARIILFLASDQAAWITGQIIRSRGGQ